LRSSYRDRERFRYALRNEHGYGERDTDRIVDTCDAMIPAPSHDVDVPRHSHAIAADLLPAKEGR
jgi:hypothetical protein